MEKKKDHVPVKSLKKGLDLLSVLLFEDPTRHGIKLKTLAAKFDMPVNSVHNLLKTMQICGYVEKNGFGRYTSGNTCRRIAYANTHAAAGFREYVTEILRKAVNSVDESMVFYILENNRWVPLIRMKASGKIVKIDVEKIERYYIYETATGRVFYAFSSVEQRKILERENGNPGPHWPDYDLDIPIIRTDGYCRLLRKRYSLISYAVPILNRDGTVFGAVGIYMPPDRITPARNIAIINDLKNTAGLICEYAPMSSMM